MARASPTNNSWRGVAPSARRAPYESASIMACRLSAWPMAMRAIKANKIARANQPTA